MEAKPKFIKEFSKERHSDKRKQAAQEIRVQRQKFFSEKKSTQGKKEILQQELAELGYNTTEILRELENLQVEIENLSSKRLGEIRNYLKLKKLRADVAVGEHTYQELLQRKGAIETNEDLSKEEVHLLDSQEFEETKKILRNFYKDQTKKWVESDYSREDIERYFSEEYLASLSIQDYALLLKRFPSEMVVHVTRQGIRDHGTVFHAAGIGEYANGFMQLCEDHKLRSRLGIYLTEGLKEDTVARFLGLNRFANKVQALHYLDQLTLPEMFGYTAGSYADAKAIHFATEEAADAYYGSERGNEIFFAFPSAHIASQYKFQGQLTRAGGGYWNDQWVWTNENNGMDINAGIVFLPSDVPVDKTTGSRYEINPEGKAIENIDQKNFIKLLIKSEGFKQFAEQAQVIALEIEKQERNYGYLSEENWTIRFQGSLRYLEDIGITNRELQKAILNYSTLNSFLYLTGDTENDYNWVIDETLSKFGLQYKRSENVIPAKEFWEGYFERFPEKRPSKVVYYQGNNPTQAFRQWKQEMGITKKSNDSNLGFTDHNVLGDSEIANEGRDRFRSIALEVIEKHFRDQESNKTLSTE